MSDQSEPEDFPEPSEEVTTPDDVRYVLSTIRESLFLSEVPDNCEWVRELIERLLPDERRPLLDELTSAIDAAAERFKRKCRGKE